VNAFGSGIARYSLVAAMVVALPAACRAQAGQAAQMGAMDSTDHPAAMAAHDAMSGPISMDPHMILTPPRAPNAADSGRAAALVRTMRAALARYRDVHVAEADGFRQFLPGVKQPVYHFTNWRWAMGEMFRFDAARPTSLLYRR